VKKKITIANLILMYTVLLTLAVQSVHIYQHWLADYDETHDCSHHHEHSHHDECGVCDFSFGFFIAPDVFFFPDYIKALHHPIVLPSIEAISANTVSQPDLRGPPLA
jgi:hypothetical protein